MLKGLSWVFQLPGGMCWVLRTTGLCFTLPARYGHPATDVIVLPPTVNTLAPPLFALRFG
jgi:hypothetical protein